MSWLNPINYLLGYGHTVTNPQQINENDPLVKAVKNRSERLVEEAINDKIYYEIFSDLQSDKKNDKLEKILEVAGESLNKYYEFYTKECNDKIIEYRTELNKFLIKIESELITNHKPSKTVIIDNNSQLRELYENAYPELRGGYHNRKLKTINKKSKKSIKSKKSKTRTKKTRTKKHR